MSRRLLLVAMAPAALLALTRVAFLVLALWDLHPFWRWQPLNLAEAAALRDRGEVSRLLAAGDDPNAVYEIRRGIMGRGSRQMTPMAAALAERRDEIVQILLDGGAVPYSATAEDKP